MAGMANKQAQEISGRQQLHDALELILQAQ